MRRGLGIISGIFCIVFALALQLLVGAVIVVFVANQLPRQYSDDQKGWMRYVYVGVLVVWNVLGFLIFPKLPEPPEERALPWSLLALVPIGIRLIRAGSDAAGHRRGFDVLPRRDEKEQKLEDR